MGQGVVSLWYAEAHVALSVHILTTMVVLQLTTYRSSYTAHRILATASSVLATLCHFCAPTLDLTGIRLLSKGMVMLPTDNPISATGWFKLISPNGNHPMSTPSSEIYPGIRHACSMTPYPLVDEWVSFRLTFSPDLYIFFYFLGIFGSWEILNFRRILFLSTAG